MSKIIIRLYCKDLPEGKVSEQDLLKVKEQMKSYVNIFNGDVYHLGKGLFTGTEGWENYLSNLKK